MGPVKRPVDTASPGDRSLVRVSLLTNGVTWYLRSALLLDGDRLDVTTPRTLLGFLPVGTKRLEAYTPALRRIALGTKLYPERLAVALGLGALAVFGRLSTLGTVFATVGAVAMLLLSFIAVLRIEGEARRPFVVPICLAHIGRARRFVSRVEAGP